MTLASTSVVDKFIGIKYIHLVMQPTPPSISRTFSFSQTETVLLKTNSSTIPQPPSSGATAILLSVCVNLATLGNVYEWNHIIFVFL